MGQQNGAEQKSRSSTSVKRSRARAAVIGLVLAALILAGLVDERRTILLKRIIQSSGNKLEQSQRPQQESSQRQNQPNETSYLLPEKAAADDDGASQNQRQQPLIPQEKQAQRPDLTVITAFSYNHFLESIRMFSSLLNHNNLRTNALNVVVYLMHEPSETLPPAMRYDLSKELYLRTKSNSSIIVIEYEVSEEYLTYCVSLLLMVVVIIVDVRGCWREAKLFGSERPRAHIVLIPFFLLTNSTV